MVVGELASHRTVFIHASHRTSSTWIWSKFRQNPDCLAFYECFHEALASLTPAEIFACRPDRWPSRHPPVDPYFLEYLPLLGRHGGLPFYRPAMALDSFVPRGGLTGSLSLPEERHIASLIALGRAKDRVPVLNCTRTLGRIGAIRDRFPGLHLSLYRDIHSQWISFCAQHARGNSYFLRSMLVTLRRNRHDPIFESIARSLPPPLRVSSTYTNKALPLDDALFLAFVKFHLYLTLFGRAHSDLSIDTTRLAEDSAYRKTTAEIIRRCCGLTVDFADAQPSAERFDWRPADCGALIQQIERFMTDEIAPRLAAAAEPQPLFDIAQAQIMPLYDMMRVQAPHRRPASEPTRPAATSARWRRRVVHWITTPHLTMSRVRRAAHFLHDMSAHARIQHRQRRPATITPAIG